MHSCVTKTSKNSGHLNNGQPCFTTVTHDSVVTLRMNTSSMSDYDKDLVLLGKISSAICNVDLTTASRRKEQKARKQQRITYSVEAERVQRSFQVYALLSRYVA